MLLESMNVLVMGVANDQSIAWGIAHRMAMAGARVIMTYESDKTAKFTRPLFDRLPDPEAALSGCACERSHTFVKLDVNSAADWESLHEAIIQRHDRIDCIVHSIAFCDYNTLNGDVLAADGEHLKAAIGTSALSLIWTADRLKSLMVPGGSIITLGYLGSERVVPGYEVMGICKATLDQVVRTLTARLGPQGIRVYNVCPGPIETRAAAKGLARFGEIRDDHLENAPSGRLPSQTEVGNVCVALASDLFKGASGCRIYVDGGRHVVV